MTPSFPWSPGAESLEGLMVMAWEEALEIAMRRLSECGVE